MAEVKVDSVFAGYRIEGVAGRGGMGVVYRARQLRPERLVALKVIAPELAADPDFRARFDRESEVAASIEHPNVIPVYEVNEEDGSLYIAMRYVEGTDLRSLIGSGMGPERAARIIAQVGSALDAAHARGLVHRDIKPGNVLISRPSGQDHAYLTDFGLAKEAASKEGFTRTGEWVGTIDYVPPEQIEGKGVDARSDVYALGCLLYQTLTGLVPYERDSEVAKMWAHINEPPPALSETGRPFPPGLDEVIRRGMAKRPEERHPSAGDLGRAALAVSQGLTAPGVERSVARGAAAPGAAEATAPGAATGATVVAGGATAPAPTDAAGQPATAPAATGVPDTAPATTRPRWRRPAVIAGAATLLLALVGGPVALMALSGGEKKPQRAGVIVGSPIPVGRSPTAITTGAGSVWVANLRGNDLSRIDARTGEPVGKPIPVGGQPYGVAVGEGAVWVVLFKDGALRRVDPRSGTARGRPIPVGRGPSDVAVGFGSVWVANYDSDTVARVDPRTSRVTARIKVGDGPTDVATGAGAVWVTNVEDDTLMRISPQSGRPLGGAIPVGQSPESVTVGAGGVWVTNIKADKVTRVDPGSNQVAGAPIPVGERPDDVAAGQGGVWVANLDGNSVTRLDPTTGRAVGRPLQVGDGPATVAVGAGSVWVGNFRVDTVTRIRP